jgi:hypothetical protein
MSFLLDTEEAKTRSDQYLEGMRNARGNRSSDPTSQSGGSSGYADTTTSTSDGRNPEGDGRGNPNDANSKRGGGRADKRARSYQQRLINGSFSTSEGDDPVAKPIGLEPVDGPVLPKFTLPDEKPSFKSKNKPLSEAEAKKLDDNLPRCIQDYGIYADRLIHYTSKVENAGDIWGDLTIDEARVISRYLIRQGMKSGYAAEVVRGIHNGQEYIALGVIALPRFIKTVEELRLAPKQRRVK